MSKNCQPLENNKRLALKLLAKYVILSIKSSEKWEDFQLQIATVRPEKQEKTSSWIFLKKHLETMFLKIFYPLSMQVLLIGLMYCISHFKFLCTTFLAMTTLLTNTDINTLTEFHRNLSEKCARNGSNAALAFSEVANECERYRERHFLCRPPKEEIERAIENFKQPKK